MRTHARLRVAAAFFVTTVATACGGDSTGPSQTPASVAAHFDSLYVEASDLSDGENAYDGRALYLTFFEVPPALGASPTAINVTTATGVEHWKAFEFSELFTPTDSGFAFLAYRESAAHTVIFIEFYGDGTIVDGALITNDTLATNITDGGGSTTLTSTGTHCGSLAPSLANPHLDSLTFVSCTLAKFRTSLTLTTQSSSNIDPALASIAITSVPVNGLRIVDAPQQASLRGARAALRAAQMRKRL